MNGELLLKGYKFSRKIVLNLQDKTVLTGEDTFTAFEVFNMMENYFNRKNFSEYFFDKGTTLILNGNVLSGEEFVVFRLRPIIDLSEELKINKRSILGQAMQTVFAGADDKITEVMDDIQRNVLSYLNAITEGYGISFVSEADNIFALAKILVPVVKESGGQEVLQQEHDQYYCKSMILDFIVRLKTNKKKLLLVELPEYGLKEEEFNKFVKLLSAAPIDNIIIYTRKVEISKIIPQIFNYHVVKDGKLYGFDDYDMLEKQLQEVMINASAEQIEQKVIKYIFSSPAGFQMKNEFTQLVDNFLIE